MMTFIAFMGMLATLVPVFIEVWRARRNTHSKATDAIRQRDLDELRAGMARVDKLYDASKPLLP